MMSGQDEETRLYQAVCDRRIPEALELLSQGTSCNVQKEKGKTALHEAMHIDYIETEEGIQLIREMLKCGASCNVQDRWGQTPVHQALRYLKRNSRDRWLGLVREMLSCGANCNLQDRLGETPLHRAAKCLKRQ